MRHQGCFQTMLPIIIYTNRKIFRHYTGFSFFLFVLISRQETLKERLIRHEKIHFYQQLELLFVFHWLLYGLFYLISRINGKGHYIAYRYNPFELEAYANDQDTAYLHHRKWFSWTRNIREFSEVQRKDMSSKIPANKNITF